MIPTAPQLRQRRWPRLAALALSALILGGQAPSPGVAGLQPPCGAAPFPPYPELGAPPTLMALDPSGLGQSWSPPACTGWTETGFTSLVAMTARFRQASGSTGLLRRAGAISEFAGMRYWSTTTKRWKTLVVQANALDGPAGDHSRTDFAPEELKEGRILYFRQEDNMSGKATYRLRIHSVSPDSLVFETENTTTLRYLFWPMFRPGELQSIYFFHRESPDVWRFYSLARTGKNASALTAGHEASAMNRSVAFFRYLVGIPTDQEPPGSP